VDIQFSPPLNEEAIFFPMYIFVTFVENEMAVAV
jgi:hypothetical protein